VVVTVLLYPYLLHQLLTPLGLANQARWVTHCSYNFCQLSGIHYGYRGNRLTGCGDGGATSFELLAASISEAAVVVADGGLRWAAL